MLLWPFSADFVEKLEKPGSLFFPRIGVQPKSPPPTSLTRPQAASVKFDPTPQLKKRSGSVRAIFVRAIFDLSLCKFGVFQQYQPKADISIGQVCLETVPFAFARCLLAKAETRIYCMLHVEQSIGDSAV